MICFNDKNKLKYMKNNKLKIIALLMMINTPVFAAINVQDNNTYTSYLLSSDVAKQTEAYSYFLKNANSDVNALFKLGKAYYYGYGTKKDENTAVGIFKKAAGMNYPPAFTMLGIHLIEKERDIAGGLEYLVKAVELKDGDAGYYIGKLYDEGKIVDQNEYYAVKYYADGAKYGNADAQYNVGIKMLKSGDKSNYARGISYLKKSAGNNHKQACVELSKLFITDNDFVSVSKRDHITYLTCAAMAGDDDSTLELADYYRIGKIVSPDEKKSAYFYNLYLVNNKNTKDGDLLFNAGVMNMKVGNSNVGIEYLQNSASNGSADGAYTLAKFYEVGYGVPVNMKQAYNYYKVSQSNGKDTVQDILRVERLLEKR